MARYFFDLETNGLLDTVTTLHSLCMINVDTGEELSYHGETMTEGLDKLYAASELIGQNIIAFDLKVLRKLNQHRPIHAKITDTIVLSRIAFPDLEDSDYRLFRKGKLPGHLIKTHKLEAWGYRFGYHKGDYSKEFKEKHPDGNPWAQWSPEMQSYCEQDVRLTKMLYERCRNSIFISEKAIALEHETHEFNVEMEHNGILFDERAAVALWQKLEARRDTLAAELQVLFPPWFAPLKEKGTALKVPKVNRRVKNPATGVPDVYTKGDPYCRIKLVEFNPRSRDHIADRLKKKYKWKPTAFTDGGKAQVDEKVLGVLPYPEAKPLAQLLMLEKRIGQIADGKEAWLKAVKPDKRIHPRTMHIGTITARSSHASPNISQVPKVSKPYGPECRSLFIAPPGYVMVGADLQSLELRVLGHYLSKWDKGAYAEIVVHGKPHAINRDAMQLGQWFPDPQLGYDKAKTVLYAILYGSGDEHAGEIIIGDPQAKNIDRTSDFSEQCKAIGKKIKKNWRKGVPGLGELIDSVKATAKANGNLRLIDKRFVPVRAAHSSLNTLLQGTGAVLCKGWLTRARRYLHEEGLTQGVGNDFASIIWSHDELQFEVREGLEHRVGPVLLKAALDTGKAFGFVPPLDAEYKVGRNWADTH